MSDTDDKIEAAKAAQRRFGIKPITDKVTIFDEPEDDGTGGRKQPAKRRMVRTNGGGTQREGRSL